MARTISEIKDGITAEWMRNRDVARAYGFDVGTPFSQWFSPVSVESLLFYIVACATWTLETLFATYRTEVEQYIDAALPHRPQWYRDKVLGFMKDKALAPDSDRYDTTGMTATDIARAKVVQYAAVTENADASILTIKVAGESGGRRTPLNAATAKQVEQYIAEIKDAGVRTTLVNLSADRFSAEVSIFYNALLSPAMVEKTARDAIRRYVENLPFNGEYSNMALVDALQTAIEGEPIVEVKHATTYISGESTPTLITVRHTPTAGYFSVADSDITLHLQPK